MRPSSRRFFFSLDAFFFSLSLSLCLSPPKRRDFLYRPTFADIASQISPRKCSTEWIIFGYQSLLESNNVSREMEISPSKHILSRKNSISIFDRARERDIINDRSRLFSIDFVMKSQCAETRKRDTDVTGRI